MKTKYLKTKYLKTTKNQVFNFVNLDLFKRSKPEEILLEILQTFTKLYSNEVHALINFLLKMFAEGLEYQKGAIFGFGESAIKDTPQHVAKI